MATENYRNLLEIKSLNEFVDRLSQFNKSNEAAFKFPYLNENDLKKDLIEKFQVWLSEVINQLKSPIEGDKELHFKCICSCLTAIRIISRDKDFIDQAFSNEQLLKIIQTLAGLNDDSAASSFEIQDTNQILKLNFLNLNNQQQNQEIVNLALQSMANLIYNSNYVQQYYAKTTLVEAITSCIKEFNVKFYNSYTSICMFDLRLLFLLTIFNRSLCLKLKESFQILTYLIEIIDQVIKDRLNDKRSRINNESAATVASNSSASKNNRIEYCFLKSSDVDYLIELLKLLFNLTMDKQTSNKISIEEYEAHLMLLVSKLRDLLTCREEVLDSIEEDQAEVVVKQEMNKSKLDELHSNIINLLVNMPLFCFEELLIPLNSNENVKQVIKNSKKFIKGKRLPSRNKLTETSGGSNPSDPDHLLNDYEFEGKNIEAVSIILRYLKKCLNLYLNRSTGDKLNIKNPQFVSDHLQPVLLLLSLMAKSNRVVRKYCRFKILPALGEEVYKLPTQGNRLRNQLACLMTDANLHIKRLTEQFLYVLCKENIGRLIKYTGFGNAAGLIADIGFLKLNLSKDTKDVDAYSTDSESSDTEEYERIKEYVNQVTGRYEKDRKNLFDGLSEEQKEQIAHELMYNIDKLSKLGVIKPAGIDEEGKLVELSHVLEVPDYIQKTKNLKLLNKNEDSDDNEDDCDISKPSGSRE